MYTKVPHLKSSLQQQDVLMKDLENQANTANDLPTVLITREVQPSFQVAALQQQLQKSDDANGRMDQEAGL